MVSKELAKASKLFNNQKYSEVIHLLEPKILYYKDSFIYFHLLGLSCLLIGDSGSADTYLTAANKLNKNNIEIKLAIAIVYLKKQQTNSAISILLNLIENEQTKKDASNLLSAVEKSESHHALTEFLDLRTTNIIKRRNKFKIKTKREINLKPFFYTLIIIAILTVGSLLAYKYKDLIIEHKSRLNIDKIEISPNQQYSDYSQDSFKIIMKDNDIKQSFNRAKKYFNNFDDNNAQREINRLFNSNASTDIKDKAQAIERLIKEPDFQSIKTNFTIDEVNEQPFLYRNCYVKWSGSIANIEYGSKKIMFDLLVGYEDKKVLDGTVKVYSDYAVKIHDNYPYEVLGKIIVNDDKVFLQVISLHRLLEL